MYGLSISPCFFLESTRNIPYLYLVKQAPYCPWRREEKQGSSNQAERVVVGKQVQQGLCSDPQNAQARSSIELSPTFQSQPGTKLTGGPQTPEYAFCGQAALSTQGI